MASTVLTATTYVLNTLQMLLSLGLACASIWFFVEVVSITSLRNTNHYLLDYNVYWPQAIPWVFCVVALMAMFTACCGFAGASKRSKGLLVTHIIFQSVSVLLLIVIAIIALTLADSDGTASFVGDTIWDAFIHAQNDHGIESAFGVMEKRLQCCGAMSPRDYINKRNEFPVSCCDTYYHGWIGTYNIICDFSNSLANSRHGCSKVASEYTSIVIKAFSATSAFIALIGVINLFVMIALLRKLKNRHHPKVLVAQYEAESKKVLL
ncbi:uncharacterized protein LOC101736086 [Bombyx mori]|uniref:Tetraspanin n=1 Tax=Bombyx mori TaxID=7091 RepID=A0A8R2AKD8_BOMMO|nr:uncharacterized protein LOC101736086 [Bombyx mori]